MERAVTPARYGDDPERPGQKNSYVDFINALKDLVAEGAVPQTRIDDAVRRILRVKYQMGIFKRPYGNPELIDQVGSPKHRNVARQCVRESLVVLKNDKNALPLSKKLRRLAVVGPGAADLGMQCGGWTITGGQERAVTKANHDLDAIANQ